MTSRHKSGADDPPAAQRRRGDTLRRAIFDATLAQLTSVGWTRLTMEGVAACAQTGKAALYRRWSSKLDLLVAALEHSLPSTGEVPDLGSLREDLLYVLERTRNAMYSPAGCALRAAMDEIAAEHGGQTVQTLIQGRVLDPGRRVFVQVLERGIARGEVRGGADAALLADVGPAMMLFQTKTNGGEIPADYPARLVDEVMLPMLRPGGAPA
jgi:AcrR family transcriptional regulator